MEIPTSNITYSITDVINSHTQTAYVARDILCINPGQQLFQSNSKRHSNQCYDKKGTNYKLRWKQERALNIIKRSKNKPSIRKYTFYLTCDTNHKSFAPTT